MNYYEEMEERILQATPSKLREIASEIEYEVFSELSREAQEKTLSVFKS